MSRSIRGALGGSRLLEQPQYAGELAARRTALQAPKVLVEVGFDHGFRLLDTARRHPDWQVVGMEVRRRRVQEVVTAAAEAGLNNLLPWRVDARIVFAGYTPEASLDVVEVYFPTPWWHPGRREKRLLVTPDFVADVARALRVGGLFLLQTDVPMTAEAIEQALASAPELSPDPGAWSDRPAIDARSRRERKCAREHVNVFRFALRKGGCL